jgi:hypothetical protein
MLVLRTHPSIADNGHIHSSLSQATLAKDKPLISHVHDFLAALVSFAKPDARPNVQCQLWPLPYDLGEEIDIAASARGMTSSSQPARDTGRTVRNTRP